VAGQVVQIERRWHPREGLMGQLEEIAYAALRRYGIIGETKPDPMNPVPAPAQIG